MYVYCDIFLITLTCQFVNKLYGDKPRKLNCDNIGQHVEKYLLSL